jgi:signal peptidase I
MQPDGGGRMTSGGRRRLARPVAPADGRPAPYTAGPVSRRRRGCLVELLQTLILTTVVFLGVQVFVAQPFRVEQQSMEPTVRPDQYVLVDKLTPRLTGYRRGDIIVFEPPADWVDPGTEFIKRVVGLPGEHLDIVGGHVLINGVPLSEPYLPAGVVTGATGTQQAWTIPAGEVFVMGDNRPDSADSRVFGPVPISAITGRALLRYWPPLDAGILGAGPSPSMPVASPSGSRPLAAAW